MDIVNPLVEKFKKEFAQREERYQSQMTELRENIDKGVAGVKKEDGQWYIEVGQDLTYDEVFGQGLNKLEVTP